MGVAADRLAAVAIVGKQLGFVTDADLSHLDPGLQGSGQVFNKLSKVDPLFRHIIEDHPLAAEDGLDIDQIHLQAALGGKLSASRQALPNTVAQPAFHRDILGRRNPENLAPERILQELGRSIRRRTENLADLGSTITPENNSLAPGMGLPFHAIIFANMTHLAVADDEAIHIEEIRFKLEGDWTA
jgi:hypothetical protein